MSKQINLYFGHFIQNCLNYNIKIVRPAFGLEPKHYNYLLGKKSKKSISFASPIKWNCVKSSKKFRKID